MSTEYEFHPYANIFPLMAADEESTLREDIRKHGLLKPILLFEGKILDGRNRYRQCAAVSVEPRYEEFIGTKRESLDLVRSLNLCRRDLTSSQRAACSLEYEAECAKLAKEAQRESGGDKKSADYREGKSVVQIVEQPIDANARKAVAVAAEAFGTNKQYVSDAKKIAEVSPGTIEKVKAGELTIPQAKKELGLSKPKPTGKSLVNGELVDDPPQIAKQRAKGLIPADVIPEVTTLEGATIEDVKEEHEERRAKQEDADGDEEWLKGLKLTAVLTGLPLKRFRADALLYRHLARARDTFKRNVAVLLNKSRIRGPYAYQCRRFLGIKDPSAWMVCPPLDKGGCGGTGQVKLIGNCPMCHGDGYRLW
jgi:hypothetical protein